MLLLLAKKKKTHEFLYDTRTEKCSFAPNYNKYIIMGNYICTSSLVLKCLRQFQSCRIVQITDGLVLSIFNMNYFY